MIYIAKEKPSQIVMDEINKIKRSTEWKEIAEDDTKAIRAQFDILPKEEIRKCLLKEQHYLCAYCMRRIENDSLHTMIEHWTPLSKDKNEALDYLNMLAVCDGGRRTELSEGKPRVLCCDAHKGDNTEMMLNPTNRQQMSLIKYTSQGKIYTYPENVKMNENINNTLQLNGVLDRDGNLKMDTSTQLVKGRRDAYEQCQKFFAQLNKAGKCNSNMLRKRIESIESQEKMPEYAGVTLFFLRKKYKELIKRGM